MLGFVPASGAQPDTAVGPDFERFDGLTPLDHPAGQEFPYGDPGTAGAHTPRPGQGPTPLADQTFTPGAVPGVVGVLDGQPPDLRGGWGRGGGRYKPEGDYTHALAFTTQHRLGVGQNFQGVAQTVALSEITSNPPEPGDLTSILAGQG